MQDILRLPKSDNTSDHTSFAADAESSSRPLTPSPPSAREAGELIARTDTLIRTQTITQKERYIPPFYRFCTITFATFATFATLAFSIHLHINP